MSFQSFRILVLAVALLVGAIAAYSGPASAHTMKGYHYGWHYGWHKGWHRNYAMAPLYAAPVTYNGCYQREWVWTDAGWQMGWANACNTNAGLFGIGLLGF